MQHLANCITTCVLIAFCFLTFFLTVGDPDIIDAIIKHLMK